MKKFLWLAILAATIFSCKDDDGNVNVTGTWVVVSEAYTDCNDPDDNYVETDDDGCDDGTCITWEFSSGKVTFTYHDGGDSDSETGTYNVKGSKLTIDGYALTVKRSGNTLTMTTDDDSCTDTITLTKID